MGEPRRRWHVRVGIWLVQHRLYHLGRAWTELHWFVSERLFKLRWLLQRRFGTTCKKHPNWPIQYGMCFMCKLEQARQLAALKPRKP